MEEEKAEAWRVLARKHKHRVVSVDGVCPLYVFTLRTEQDSCGQSARELRDIIDVAVRCINKEAIMYDKLTQENKQRCGVAF